MNGILFCLLFVVGMRVCTLRSGSSSLVCKKLPCPRACLTKVSCWGRSPRTWWVSPSRTDMSLLFASRAPRNRTWISPHTLPHLPWEPWYDRTNSLCIFGFYFARFWFVCGCTFFVTQIVSVCFTKIPYVRHVLIDMTRWCKKIGHIGCRYDF